MGQSFTYPDGSSLASTALTVQQMGTVMQNVIAAMLGITDPASSSLVRVSWPTQGAPFQDVSDDICYVRATPKDVPYDKIRKRHNWDLSQLGYGQGPYGMFPYGGSGGYGQVPYGEAPYGEAPMFLVEQWTYTRAWQIHLVLYGPNSTDRARAIRSALYQDFFTEALSNYELFPVSDFPQATRTPELIDGQWLDRADFTFEML